MSELLLNRRYGRRSTQYGGAKGKKEKHNITKKSNPIVTFNRTSEIQRRLDIERIRRRQEEELKKLRKTNRNRLYEDHLRFIKHKINASRQQERNQGYRTENENRSSNHSSRNSTEYYNSKPSSKSTSKSTSKSSSNQPVRPANRNQAFHEVRQRMQEAASRQAASREASRPSDKVHASQSWRNYLKQKIGWWSWPTHII